VTARSRRVLVPLVNFVLNAILALAAGKGGWQPCRATAGAIA
jgi:hypothetical protein